MRRRMVLAAGGCALALSAGCLDRGALGREDTWRELVVDPPEGVYVPSKVDSMTTYGTDTVDGRAVSIAATRPHSFWTLAGDERARADVRDHHALHLMVAVRDAETGVVVPTTVSTSIDGGDERTLWPMLSQRMGVHYGDNVPLDDGTHRLSVRLGPTDAVIADGIDDRATQATTVEFEFEHRAAEIDALDRRLIDEDEGRGEPGAVEPMNHDEHAGDDHDQSDGHDQDDSHADHDHDALQALTEPWLGAATADDLEFALGIVEDEPSGAVLAVVPRTRYNRYPVPLASLSVEFRDDGATVTRAALGERLDGEFGHHYATDVDRELLEQADELAVVVDVPPQLSRHEGYETAFFDVEPVSITTEY
jgi:hypothetical protein